MVQHSGVAKQKEFGKTKKGSRQSHSPPSATSPSLENCRPCPFICPLPCYFLVPTFNEMELLPSALSKFDTLSSGTRCEFAQIIRRARIGPIDPQIKLKQIIGVSINTVQSQIVDARNASWIVRGAWIHSPSGRVCLQACNRTCPIGTRPQDACMHAGEFSAKLATMTPIASHALIVLRFLAPGRVWRSNYPTPRTSILPAYNFELLSYYYVP